MARNSRRKAAEPALDELADVTTALIYRAISRSGRHELARPFSALWWSGVGAGLAISLSILCKGILTALLPDTAWAPAVTNLGYSVGFLVVIMGRMQLFTENTVTPILPLLAYPSISRLNQTARLWAIVFAANMTGCLIAAILMVHAGIIPPLQMSGVLSVSRHYAEVAPLDHLLWGMPAGFMIASLVWMLPRIESAGEVLMITIVTYMIGLGGFSHVVAGSTELFIVMLMGELSPIKAVFGGILPALVGNVIGGTVIFAALAYAQVREEI
ncbi:formate/nitrite transporter family protein [Sphingomonas ursincola]|jgi:formate/nitrite transporter FocA (FNT family)|uniref:formate/nitrite transporter family protein n=1 Tax=Sphingomonas ursincola TaxID=56361 RepID=UPI002353C267|nr:formate/nitrite transporter family protein [Sphingomonas ursincola]MBY0618598.1 formate/nitrite transporter family protein [Sphingomonas ursincola]